MKAWLNPQLENNFTIEEDCVNYSIWFVIYLKTYLKSECLIAYVIQRQVHMISMCHKQITPLFSHLVFKSWFGYINELPPTFLVKVCACSLVKTTPVYSHIKASVWIRSKESMALSLSHCFISIWSHALLIKFLCLPCRL